MTFFPLRALWKGLRGRSLTFSTVFAMAVMGSSFAGLLRMPLRTVGIWGPLVLLLPIIATALLAKQEQRLPVSIAFKRTCSIILIFGSVLLATLIGRYENWLGHRSKRGAFSGSRQQAGPPARSPRATVLGGIPPLYS